MLSQQKKASTGSIQAKSVSILYSLTRPRQRTLADPSCCLMTWKLCFLSIPNRISGIEVDMTIIPFWFRVSEKRPIGEEMSIKTNAPRMQNIVFSCTCNQLFSAFFNFVFAQVLLLNQVLFSFWRVLKQRRSQLVEMASLYAGKDAFIVYHRSFCRTKEDLI